MNFYYDESGGFVVPASADEPAAGIVAGVSIPESVEARVFDRFERFVAGLPASASQKGEPKGRLMDDGALNAFCDFVFDEEHVSVTPVVLDLASLATPHETPKELVVAKLELLALQCKHEAMRDNVRLLARQFANLSLPQALRLTALARAVMYSLSSAIVLRARAEYHADWERIRFTIDSVQCRPASREEEVFKWMVLAWVKAWSLGSPLTLLEELHTPEHPFVKRYDRAGGIDLGAIFKGNLYWQSSARCLGLQMADMAATVVDRATRGIVTPAALTRYGRMLYGAGESPFMAPGIFSLVELPEAIARRYSGLADSVAAVRCLE